MGSIVCPACRRANSDDLIKCKYCGETLRKEEEYKPLNLGKISVPRPEMADNNAQQTPAEELPELPETEAEQGPEQAGEKQKASLLDQYAGSMRFNSPEDAASEFAEEFVTEHSNGREMIMKETARKRLIAVVIFTVAAFITLSLMMLYHRNILVYLMILAALSFGLYRYKVNNRKLLIKKLTSMPEADMESVLMSEIDNMVPKKRNDLCRIGIITVAALLFIVLFWSPRLIIEEGQDGCSIRFYSLAFSPKADVVLPDTWNGKPVTEIRGNVFEGLGSIRSVVLPNQLVSIRAHAFRGCGSLSEVVFPDTIRSIGSSAFRDCGMLRNVTLPEECSVDMRSFKGSPTKIERK